MEQRNAIAFQNFGSHNFLGHANRKYYSTSSQLFLDFDVIEDVKLLAIMCLLNSNFSWLGILYLICDAGCNSWDGYDSQEFPCFF